MQSLETSPQKHPATRAWLSLEPHHSPPNRVVELKPERRKSAVYRLDGVGVHGGPVIAKRCASSTVAIERTVYQEVLPHVPYPTLRFYGAVIEPGGDVGWIFVEDADGVSYSDANPEHRALAAVWLAVLHTSVASLRGSVSLPDRGLKYHQDNMSLAREVLSSSIDNPALSASGMAEVEAISSQCSVIESHWVDVTALLEGIPCTLVHGGFGGKNARIRGSSGKYSVGAFDWESAGWGAPILDLAHVDVGEYKRCLGDKWPQLTSERLGSLSRLGAVFGALKAIPGEAKTLASPWASKAEGKLGYYRAVIAEATSALWHDE